MAHSSGQIKELAWWMNVDLGNDTSTVSKRKHILYIFMKYENTEIIIFLRSYSFLDKILTVLG